MNFPVVERQAIRNLPLIGAKLNYIKLYTYISVIFDMLQTKDYSQLSNLLVLLN